MDDLSRARDTITRCCATLLDASYTDGIPTETTDVWRTIAADARRDLDALITRLRAAEREASSAGVLRCKLTHAEAQIEAAERALEDVAPGLLAEHAPVFGAILELGERLRAAEARTAWQPIETAPEGETVLVCDASGVGMAMLTEGKWQDGQGYDYEPTHWQPLPAPPASEVSRG